MRGIARGGEERATSGGPREKPKGQRDPRQRATKMARLYRNQKLGKGKEGSLERFRVVGCGVRDTARSQDSVTGAERTQHAL